jgi:hypothetical protein
MSTRKSNLFCLPPISKWFRSSSRDKPTRGWDPEASDLGINLSHVQNEPQEVSEEVRTRNKMRVKTTISKQQIKWVDEFNEENY